MHEFTRESIAAVTDHFADAFFRKNVARIYMTRDEYSQPILNQENMSVDSKMEKSNF